MDADGSNQRNLTQHPGLDLYARWSPDGSQIAFASDRHSQTGGSEIYIMNADGSGVRRLTHSNIASFMPNWMPDGERIVFATVVEVVDPQSAVPVRTEIYSMDLDGSDAERMTYTGPPYWQHHIFLADPSLSSDGKQLLATLNLPNGISYIATFRTDVNQPFEIADPVEVIELDENPGFPPSIITPRWSPDGSQIAYAKRYGSPDNLPDGIEIVTLSSKAEQTVTAGYDYLPAWSPDGAYLAFTSYVGGAYDIYVVSVTNPSPVQLTQSGTNFDPDWHE
jgi:Tol biopolymer transport system component